MSCCHRSLHFVDCRLATLWTLWNFGNVVSGVKFIPWVGYPFCSSCKKPSMSASCGHTSLSIPITSWYCSYMHCLVSDCYRCSWWSCQMWVSSAVGVPCFCWNMYHGTIKKLQKHASNDHWNNTNICFEGTSHLKMSFSQLAEECKLCTRDFVLSWSLDCIFNFCA